MTPLYWIEASIRSACRSWTETSQPLSSRPRVSRAAPKPGSRSAFGLLIELGWQPLWPPGIYSVPWKRRRPHLRGWVAPRRLTPRGVFAEAGVIHQLPAAAKADAAAPE